MPFNTTLQNYSLFTLVNSATVRLVGSAHDYNYETLTFYENEHFSGRDQVFYVDSPPHTRTFKNDFGR